MAHRRAPVSQAEITRCLKAGTITAERLRGVRTFVHSDEPDTIVLKIEGAAETYHFLLHLRDLKRLADWLTQDAALLAAGRLEQ